MILLLCVLVSAINCFDEDNMNSILENIKNYQNDPEAMNRIGEKLIKEMSKNQKGKHPEMFPVAGTIIRNSPIRREADSL